MAPTFLYGHTLNNVSALSTALGEGGGNSAKHDVAKVEGERRGQLRERERMDWIWLSLNEMWREAEDCLVWRKHVLVVLPQWIEIIVSQDDD